LDPCLGRSARDPGGIPGASPPAAATGPYAVRRRPERHAAKVRALVGWRSLALSTRRPPRTSARRAR